MKINIKKGLITLLLTITVFFTFVPLGVFATTGDLEVTSGYITYKIMGDGTALVYDCDSGATGIVSIKSKVDGYPVTGIRSEAFWGCKKITEIIIPNSVTYIGGAAFDSCTGLTEVTIPDGVISIGGSAFYGCTGLTEITIPDSVVSIGKLAFYGSGYYNRSANWDNGVLYIGNHLIESKDISGIHSIKSGTLTLAEGSFENCPGLTKVIIPDSVSGIGSDAFKGCYKLESINVDSDNVSFSSENGVLFNNDKTKLMCYPSAKNTTDTYSIPDSVTSIEDYAFYNCYGLTTITIPDSVTSIGNSAFLYCKGLVDVAIPSSVSSIGRHAFSHCSKLSKITLPDSVTSIGISAFSDCTGLTEITISDSITIIESFVFSGCVGLTEINIPCGITSIDIQAFKGCTGLTKITIPDSVTSIGANAFYNCTSLTDVYYEGIEEEWYYDITTDSGNECLTNATIHYIIEVESILLDEIELMLDICSNETLTATILPADATNKNVVWTSSNTSVATIENGTVTAVSAGTSTITATTEDGGYTATCTVTVNEPEPPTISATGITVDKSSVTLDVGANEILIATISPIDATNKNVVWTSSNTSVATVENGTVTAVGSGTATITVTTEDGGYSAACVVTVNEVEIPPVIDDVPMVKVESVKGKAGESITVPLYIENNPGVLGMMLKISYDEGLTLTALTQSTGEDDSALESLDFTPGKDLTANPINVGWDGLDADSTNGKILNMTFTIPEDAEDGKVYDVKISYSIGDVYDNDFNDIDLAVIDGCVTVKNYTIGDVNDDGTINMKDVTLLRRGVIGGYGVTLNEAADVNCDGVTNMKDVTILRRYVIGGYGVTLG